MRDDIPDRRLALMFACAHPAIDEGVRAPLILQVVMGLSAEAIASMRACACSRPTSATGRAATAACRRRSNGATPCSTQRSSALITCVSAVRSAAGGSGKPAPIELGPVLPPQCPTSGSMNSRW